jgi:hypothetical protein
MSEVDYTELDCKLFVGVTRGVASAEQLRDAVAAAIAGTVDHLAVEADEVGVIVGDNEDADDSVDPSDSDAFLALPFLAEVYFAPAAGRAERVARVSELIMALRARGATVVPASDYEDELPG